MPSDCNRKYLSKRSFHSIAENRVFPETYNVVTIIIPTCNRAQFLREALTSVQRQTARQAIEKIIVSENSASNESQAVCNEFDSLPIHYVQQNPPGSTLDNFKWLVEQAKSESLIAMLHDDDWWAPGHLEAATNVLATRPDCAAVYSNFIETIGPSYPGQLFSYGWFIWLASGCDYDKPVIMLDKVCVTLICLLNFAFHYSSLVARAEAMRQAFQRVVASGNLYDNDRLLPVYLSAYGNLGYITPPDTFIRRHSDQDSAPYHAEKKHFKFAAVTTRHLLTTEPEAVAGAAEKFAHLLDQLSEDKLKYVYYATEGIEDPQRGVLINECGLRLKPRGWRSRAKWLAKLSCPPGLVSVARDLSKRAAALR